MYPPNTQTYTCICGSTQPRYPYTCTEHTVYAWQPLDCSQGKPQPDKNQNEAILLANTLVTQYG